VLTRKITINNLQKYCENVVRFILNVTNARNVAQMFYGKKITKNSIVINLPFDRRRLKREARTGQTDGRTDGQDA